MDADYPLTRPAPCINRRKTQAAAPKRSDAEDIGHVLIAHMPGDVGRLRKATEVN
jgi:hypothetical protein